MTGIEPRPVSPNVAVRRPRHSVWLTAALFTLVGILLSGPLRQFVDARQNGATGPRAVTPRPDLFQREQDTINLFQAVSPSVVYITSIAFQRDYFSLNLYKIPQGSGSGFIWNDEGYIVTNYHVIQNAQESEVTLSDHSTWKAKVVGFEPDKDLAIIKIDAPAEKLRPIAVGTSADLLVGQYVYAIGNPFGLDQTLTTGVISGLGREIESVTRRPIQGVIQTDAAINPGNSGGPLLDSAGRLIGVNTAIYSPSGAYAGIGFAVPVDSINRIVPQLIEHGRIIKPGLGIRIAEDYVVRRLGLSGVLVLSVAPGSGAESAGIVPTRRDNRGRVLLGDIIVFIDGKETRDSDSLFRLLDDHRVGDEVDVTISRDGKESIVRVVLGAIQ